MDHAAGATVLMANVSLIAASLPPRTTAPSRATPALLINAKGVMHKRPSLW